jgi:hypothetical protein
MVKFLFDEKLVFEKEVMRDAGKLSALGWSFTVVL